jgi:hypothetical protein
VGSITVVAVAMVRDSFERRVYRQEERSKEGRK